MPKRCLTCTLFPSPSELPVPHQRIPVSFRDRRPRLSWDCAHPERIFRLLDILTLVQFVLTDFERQDKIWPLKAQIV